MSQENVEFVRRYYVKWNAGKVEEMAALLPEEVIVDLSAEARPRGVERPRCRDLVRENLAPTVGQPPARARTSRRGRRSGLAVRAHHCPRQRQPCPGSGPCGTRLDVSGWHPVRLDYYAERSEALEAVGLSEQDAHPEF